MTHKGLSSEMLHVHNPSFTTVAGLQSNALHLTSPCPADSILNLWVITGGCDSSTTMEERPGFTEGSGRAGYLKSTTESTQHVSDTKAPGLYGQTAA